MSDYYEIFNSGTNPLIADTDGNGILDGDEKFEQTYTKNTTNDIITKISINGDFSRDIDETISIRSIIDEDMMCANVVGLVGEPFDIETTSNFDTANITFTVDESQLNGKSLDDLLLLWYDEENDNFVELNTQVNTENSTISLTTTHFSKYMLVDKQEWFDCWKNAPNYFDSDLYTPYNTSICIDCSGSMDESDPDFIYNQLFPNLWTTYADNEYVNYRKMAVERYIWAMQSQDQTSLIHFDDTNPIPSEDICDLTSNQNILISKLHPSNGRGTDAKLAIELAIGQLSAQMDNHNRIIILLSDGDVNIDTSDNDIDGIITSCITNKIKIYTIGLGSNANNSVLESLAEKTYGKFFTATTADELSKMYNNIRVEQYKSIDWANNDGEDNAGDGIPDYFETQGMMCSNGQLIFTDPNNPDCDGDGLLDGDEIEVTYSQKYIQGAGNEGHSINAVYFKYKSNPNKRDSDEDGLDDYVDKKPLEYYNNISNCVLYEAYLNTQDKELYEKYIANYDEDDVLNHNLKSCLFTDTDNCKHIGYYCENCHDFVVIAPEEQDEELLNVPQLTLVKSLNYKAMCYVNNGDTKSAEILFHIVDDIRSQTAGNRYQYQSNGSYISPLYFEYENNYNYINDENKGMYARITMIQKDITDDMRDTLFWTEYSVAIGSYTSVGSLIWGLGMMINDYINDDNDDIDTFLVDTTSQGIAIYDTLKKHSGLIQYSNEFAILNGIYQEYMELKKINNNYYPKYDYSIVLEIYDENSTKYCTLDYIFNNNSEIPKLPYREEESFFEFKSYNYNLSNMYFIKTNIDTLYSVNEWNKLIVK